MDRRVGRQLRSADQDPRRQSAGCARSRGTMAAEPRPALPAHVRGVGFRSSSARRAPPPRSTRHKPAARLLLVLAYVLLMHRRSAGALRGQLRPPRRRRARLRATGQAQAKRRSTPPSCSTSPARADCAGSWSAAAETTPQTTVLVVNPGGTPSPTAARRREARYPFRPARGAAALSGRRSRGLGKVGGVQVIEAAVTIIVKAARPPGAVIVTETSRRARPPCETRSTGIIVLGGGRAH